MKKIAISFILLLTPFNASDMLAQRAVSYSYDQTGNRVSRQIMLANFQQARARQKADSLPVVEESLPRTVKIYPNPTRGLLKVEIVGMQADDNCRLALYTLSGIRLKEFVMTEDYAALDLSTYTNGYYLLVIVIDGERQTWKIIKE